MATYTRYPAWLPKVLLSTTAGLLTIAAVLSVATYKLATSGVELKDLSPAQRQHLHRGVGRSPGDPQPFPLAGYPWTFCAQPSDVSLKRSRDS
jgi:hypothetical protein